MVDSFIKDLKTLPSISCIFEGAEEFRGERAISSWLQCECMRCLLWYDSPLNGWYSFTGVRNGNMSSGCK